MQLKWIDRVIAKVEDGHIYTCHLLTDEATYDHECALSRKETTRSLCYWAPVREITNLISDFMERLTCGEYAYAMESAIMIHFKDDYYNFPKEFIKAEALKARLKMLNEIKLALLSK